MTIGATRDAFRFDRVRFLSRDQLGHHNALMAGFVGKPRRPGDISNRIKAIYIRTTISIRHNMGAVDLHTKRIKAKPLDIAHNPDRGNHRVEFELFNFTARFDMGRDLTLAAVQLLDHRLFLDGHALFFELFLGKGAYLGILDRKHTIHHLDNGCIRTKRVEETCELDPDCPRPNHKELFRHPLGLQGVLIGPHEISIGLQPR